MACRPDCGERKAFGGTDNTRLKWSRRLYETGATVRAGLFNMGTTPKIPL